MCDVVKPVSHVGSGNEKEYLGLCQYLGRQGRGLASFLENKIKFLKVYTVALFLCASSLVLLLLPRGRSSVDEALFLVLNPNPHTTSFKLHTEISRFSLSLSFSQVARQPCGYLCRYSNCHKPRFSNNVARRHYRLTLFLDTPLVVQ